MGVIYLKQSGFLYEDDFDGSVLDPCWELIPNDKNRISLTEQGLLRLKGGAEPLYLFYSDLTNINQFVFDVKNIFNPSVTNDIGGLIVYEDELNFLAVEEYYDPQKGLVKSYPWIRLVRDYNYYSAYWSEDGIRWNLLGVKQFGCVNPKIGIFVNGQTDYIVDLVRITKGFKLTIDNLTAGAIVDLTDENGVTIESKIVRYGDNKVLFNLVNLNQPFKGKIDVTIPPYKLYIDSTIYNFYGGDVYSFSPSVKVSYINDEGIEKLLTTNYEEFLGYLNTGDVTYKDVILIVKNDLEVGVIKNILIKLKSYKNENQYKQYVKLVNDVGELVEEILIPELREGQSKQIILRLDRPSTMVLDSEVYFGLDVTSTLI